MLKTSLWSVALFVVCGLMTGCATGSADPKDTIGAMNEATKLLEGIKDKKSAGETKGKVVEVGKRIKANSDALAKKYPSGKGLSSADQGELAKAMLGLTAAMTEAEKSEGGADVVKAFKNAAGL